jgi:TolB-like protein/Tfp pilus assembly protein PilF
MKRCPHCNRVENDDALAFCRVDGMTLVSDSSQLSGEVGTARLGSPSAATEIETSLLPHTTDAVMSRSTAPTTVLPAQSPPSTGALAKPKRRRTAITIAIIAAAVVAAAAAIIVNSSLSRRRNASIQSVAVMPFVNASGNADLDYLSDGMTETLISSLSQLPNLNVKARSTVFRYKGKEMNPQMIGRELNVQAILNGRVVQRGDRLTLSLELIDAQTENVIWSDKYERNQTDLVSLQNEIARDVSSKLKLKLSGADQQKLAKTYTTDPEAYRLYLQGRFYLNKRVGNEFDKAEGYFQQAIAKDPNLALGYVGLAEFISERDRPKAKEYIMRALAIDNQLSDAHASLGYQLMLDYDFAASEREFRRAIELDPNNGRAYQWNGSRLMMMGLYDQALASFDRAIEIEPTRADIRNNRGACLVAAGRIDDGIAEIKKSMELDPTFPWAHSHISFVYRMRGDHAASVEERARAFELLDRADQATRMRESFAKSGWTGYLREIVSQDWGRLGTSQTRRASLLAELGEKEAAMARLNEAATKGDSWLFSIKYDPAFDPLRDDPRFKEVLKRLDLPE